MRIISVLVAAALVAATPVAAAPSLAAGLSASPASTNPAIANAPQAQASDSLVTNGDFEEPPQLPGSDTYLSSLPGWTMAQGTTVEIDNYSQRARSGVQYLELDSNTARSIYQDLPTQPGMHYLLSFAYSPRPQRSAANNVLQVQWAGKQVGPLISADGTALTVPSWTVYQYVVLAANPTTRLQFNSPGGSPYPGFTLDSVSLIPLGGGNNSWTTAQEIVLAPDSTAPQALSGSAMSGSKLS
ncbi:MAG TPA: DUF642 domain-containing protein, partial [Anaerolineales bacterium]